MPVELTILGTSSATPTTDRHPSAQHLLMGDHNMMIDCGEAAQMQLMRYGLKSFRIDKIFISHLHPDHYLGLPGLISSYSLKGRIEPLHIFCPYGLKEILEVQFKYGDVHISYDIIYHFLTENSWENIFEDRQMQVQSFSVQHRLPCWGFIFKEKKAPRKINKDIPEVHQLPIEAFACFRHANDFVTADGKILHYQDYTIPNTPPLCYVYITDTIFLPEVAEKLAAFDIDLLYHESTFLEELKEKAIHTFHSTAAEAALFAKIARARKLMIGHYSSRYKNPEVLLQEAKKTFADTILAVEGEKYQV